MAISITEIYRSSNCDRWQLVRINDPTSTLVRLIRHLLDKRRIPPLADFLIANGLGPEYAALRRLLEITADEPEDP